MTTRAPATPNEENPMPSTVADKIDYPRTTTKTHTPCARCGCRLKEDVTEHRPAGSFEAGPPDRITSEYHAPDPACGCTCHAGYRMVNRLSFDRKAW